MALARCVGTSVLSAVIKSQTIPTDSQDFHMVLFVLCTHAASLLKLGTLVSRHELCVTEKEMQTGYLHSCHGNGRDKKSDPVPVYLSP